MVCVCLLALRSLRLEGFIHHLRSSRQSSSTNALGFCGKKTLHCMHTNESQKHNLGSSQE
eukprot:5486952-Amphidinium_carterae.1